MRRRGQQAPNMPRLFVRAVPVGANIDRSPAQCSGNVDRGGSFRIAGADRPRVGPQPEVINELSGIKINKHAGSAGPVNDVWSPCIPGLKTPHFGLPST
jgi:hypothetical protein